jgi:hypothetical protein
MEFETYLEVDVLQAAHDNAVHGVLGQLEALVGLEALDVDQSAHKLGVQGALVGETLDVLGRVGVDVLERAGKLVVEPLDKGDDAAGDAEKLAGGDGGELLVILPLLSVLNNDNLLAALEDLEKLGKLLVGAASC